MLALCVLRRRLLTERFFACHPQAHGFSGKQAPLTSHLQFARFSGGPSSGPNQKLHRICSGWSSWPAPWGGSALNPVPLRRGLPLCSHLSLCPLSSPARSRRVQGQPLTSLCFPALPWDLGSRLPCSALRSTREPGCRPGRKWPRQVAGRMT